METMAYGFSNGSGDVDYEQNEEVLDYGIVRPLVDWLNTLLPELNLPLNPSVKELRACLADGTVLCNVLEKLSPGIIKMRGYSEPGRERIERFLAAMDELELPRFVLDDMQQGYAEPVLRCLGSLKAHFEHNSTKSSTHNLLKRWNQPKFDFSVYDRSHNIASTGGNSCTPDEKEEQTTHSSANVKPDALGLLKSNGLELDNASTRSLFKLLNTLLEGSPERNGHANHITPIVRKIVQVLEQRTSVQAENLKDQNHHIEDFMERYQSRTKVLETLAVGTTDEIEVLQLKLQQITIEKNKVEEEKKLEEQNLLRLKEEKSQCERENLKLKEELELAKRTNEENCLELKIQAEDSMAELNKKLQECERLLKKSRAKVKELESDSESKYTGWKRKEGAYRSYIGRHFNALQELRAASETIKSEFLKAKRSYSEEVNHFGDKLKLLAEAAGNYQSVLAENRRLYNEVQDLKGNIRVYCRVRPFLPGQTRKQTTIQYIGENGELIVSNPSKNGKQSNRLFKFNKIFDPTASQEDVYLDTQPLIRTVLDGYNVCIFAYGQTGSGKTYTMSGPSLSSEEDWGVNYRALHDLFQISQSRRSSMTYEVGVQMVEIYNEQVLDLLSDSSSRKRLGIWNTTQPNGLAVPDASMYPVTSTADVLELMEVGLKNRAMSTTALNERSSRSHSVVTVHVRGTELRTGVVLRGSLHLIDLAGSERVDRSEVTGDRLKEAQHINRSLSALGDVIFALAQKSPHVPYRNSKLTQLLQGSLGGQAKALMFVQLNPDVDSYSETVSTLKFAERVSGVELGAARSNKESREIRELMDQVTSLKNSIAKKDEEIEQLQLFKADFVDLRSSDNLFKYNCPSPRRYSTAMPMQSPRLSRCASPAARDKSTFDFDKCSVNSEARSEAVSPARTHSLRRAQSKSMIELKPQKESHPEGKSVGADVGQNTKDDIDLLSFGDADTEERLSDISDGVLSMTETEASIASAVEFTLFPQSATPAVALESSEAAKPAEGMKLGEGAKRAEIWKPTEDVKMVEKPEKPLRRSNSVSKLPKPPHRLQQTLQQTVLSRLSLSKGPGPGPVAKSNSGVSTPRRTGSLPTTRLMKQWH